MPAKLISPVEKEFILEKTDVLLDNEGTPTIVIIRQATQRQHMLRTDKYANLTQEVNQETPETSRYITKFNYFDLHMTEAFLTMVSCDIQDSDGKDLFKFKQDSKGKRQLDMSEPQFREAWGALPREIAEEIIGKVHEVNIFWQPSGEVL